MSKFTPEDVLDAYFTRKTDEYSRANKQSADATLREFQQISYDGLTNKKLGSSLESDRAQYVRGKEILSRARLAVSSRFMDAGGTRALAAEELGNVDSEIEFVDAGYIATSPAKRAIALKAR